MRGALRAVRSVVAGLGTLCLAWLAGLGCFLYLGIIATGDRGAATDAIVVLTGGRFRLESGLDLLEAGKARKLFISGVNQHVDREALLRVFGPLPDSATCCIVLGHEADNTLGNARETAAWMRQEGYRSLRLVTSWYHMPRSRLEFARAIPEAAIVANPVFPAHPGAERWPVQVRAAGLVLTEYHKYLAALVRPAAASVVRLFPEFARPDLLGEAAGKPERRQQ